MAYTNSSLATYTQLSPNHSGERTHSIDRISPHCVVGQLSAKSIAGLFASSSRGASCNYAIGTSGDVALVVEEKNRSWCTSSNANDQRAITIECASDLTAPYAFNTTVYNKLVELCTDICKRNGKKKLLWLNDYNTSVNYSPASDEMVLTVHRWFANKSCPGDWMFARMGDLASKVTAALGGTTTSTTTTTTSTYPAVPFTVKVLVDDLNIRTSAEMGNNKTGKYTGKGEFTITEVKNGWGKLKSGAGWIYLANASYVTIGKTVTTTATTTTTSKYPAVPFTVQVVVSDLNIRTSPEQKTGNTTGKFTGRGQFTITKVSGDWGYLNSGAGWIYLGNSSYVTIGKTTTSTTTQTTTTKKSNEEIAKEVIAGKWGNGADRKAKLKAAGYDPDVIQKLVNQMLK